MLRRVFAWLRARLGRGGGEGEGSDGDVAETGSGDDSDGESEGSRFLPSRLDASVLVAHGMGSSQAERELAQVEEQARELEAQDPEHSGNHDREQHR